MAHDRKTKPGWVTFIWNGNLAEAIHELAAMGYEGIEILEKRSYYDPYRENPEALGRKLAQARMTMIAMAVAADLYKKETADQEIEHCLKTAASVATVEGEFLLIVPGSRAFEGSRLGLTDDQYKYLAESLNRIGRDCRKFGITCCYTPHVRQMIERRHEMNRLLDLTDSDCLKLCYDPSHIYLGGWDPLECIEQHKDRIAYVHLRNFMDGQYSNPDTGEIAMEEVLQALERARYSGWVLPCMPAYSHYGKSEAQVAKDNLAYLKIKLW